MFSLEKDEKDKSGEIEKSKEATAVAGLLSLEKETDGPNKTNSVHGIATGTIIVKEKDDSDVIIENESAEFSDKKGSRSNNAQNKNSDYSELFSGKPVQNDSSNYYNKDGFNVKEVYKKGLSAFVAKNNLANLSSGPFGIFKSKIKCSNTLLGVVREKTLFMYFLYRNLRCTKEYEELYRAYVPRPENKSIESYKIGEMYLVGNRTGNRVRNRAVSLPKYRDNHFACESDENCKNMKITEKKGVTRGRKSCATTKNRAIKTNKHYNPPIDNQDIRKYKGWIAENVPKIRTISEKEPEYRNVPYLVWIDSMVNHFIKRFYKSMDLEDDEIEIERTVFQLALRLGTEWGMMGMNQKQEWLKKAKKDVRKWMDEQKTAKENNSENEESEK
ncbi:hypothetical protein ECANGB1_1865 [Enterospora canceri]|uniref:Uncharacterized protein n=1 Tax=Enterospora canceri TaxID=1081671 RepID=A0A1Y1S5B8_9MICR|nr:hypothetical protein ECANGB1_1865 [Enterospora canceri]